MEDHGKCEERIHLNKTGAKSVKCVAAGERVVAPSCSRAELAWDLAGIAVSQSPREQELQVIIAIL